MKLVTIIDVCIELINEYDTDGSGQIEFPEFCNMMSGESVKDCVKLEFHLQEAK